MGKHFRKGGGVEKFPLETSKDYVDPPWITMSERRAEELMCTK